VTSAAARFGDEAGPYDAVRPMPPAELAEVIAAWAGVARPDVADLGAGTGLSAVIWAGRARQVTAIEPSAGMREMAERRIGAISPGAGSTGAGSTGPRTRFLIVNATAEDTGLPDASADIVTASQAMHWFDPARALPEIARVLRPGGVLAAYDCDWPPCVHWAVSAAVEQVTRRVTELEHRQGLPPPHGGKDHLVRLRDSGLFRHCTEIAVHDRDAGDAGRLVAVTLSSLGSAGQLMAAGATEDELGLTELREVAARHLPQPATWWWTYRVRLAVR
jgi:SAM-dependent methyltransferase